MSSETELTLKWIGTIIIGFLVAHGYADPAHASAVVNDAFSIIGLLIAGYGIVVGLEHAFTKFKDDLAHIDWNPNASTTTTVTTQANPDVTPATPPTS